MRGRRAAGCAPAGGTRGAAGLASPGLRDADGGRGRRPDGRPAWTQARGLPTAPGCRAGTGPGTGVRIRAAVFPVTRTDRYWETAPPRPHPPRPRGKVNQKSPAARAQGPATHRFRPAGFTAGSLGCLGNSGSALRTVEAHLAVDFCQHLFSAKCITRVTAQGVMTKKPDLFFNSCLT